MQPQNPSGPQYVQPPQPPFAPYAPQPPRKKRHAGLIIGIVAGTLAVCCGGSAIIAAFSSNKKDDAGGEPRKPASVETAVTTASAASPATTAATKKAETKSVPGLNTAVRDGKFEFVVTKVECGQKTIGNAYLNKSAQGQFCIVTLTVKNTGSKAQTFFDANQKGYGGDGAEYSTDSTAAIYVSGEQSTWINEINPGNSISGPIVFDIPTGKTLVKLKLHDSAFSGGTEVKIS